MPILIFGIFFLLVLFFCFSLSKRVDLLSKDLLLLKEENIRLSVKIDALISK